MIVLELGRGGSSLRVAAERHPGVADWFTTSITVTAHPWSGTLDTLFTADDLRTWAVRLRAPTLPRTVLLGGDRATELVLQVASQQGGTPGSLAVQVELTPSGDDPFPFLRFLLFSVAPAFGEHTADAIDALLQERSSRDG